MSYRKPNTSVAFFNPTGEIISGIGKARKGIADRFKTVEDFENAASIRNQELQDSLNDTETMEDMDALNILQGQVSKELDELYKLDIQTFEGDRSAYNKKKSEIEKIIGNIPALMALIDDEGEKLKEAQNTGNFTKQLLRSNNEDYYNFVQDASSGGKNISFKIQNGNIIAQLNGKDVFNGNSFIKAKKDGLDLVKYAGDYSAEIDETIKQNAVGLQNLVSTEVIEKMKNRETLSTEEIKNFERAKEIFEERLRESPNLGALVNESTYQLFTGYGLGEDSDNMDAWTGDDMQKAATKEALIEYMINRQFPEDKFQTKYTEKILKTKPSGKGKGKAKEDIILDFTETEEPSKDYDNLKKIESKINDLDYIEKVKQDKPKLTDKNYVRPDGTKGQLTNEEIRDLLRKRVEERKKEQLERLEKALEKYKNKEVRIGSTDYQIDAFTVTEDENGRLMFVPYKLTSERDSKGNRKQKAIPGQYYFDDLDQFENDLLEAGSLQIERSERAMQARDEDENLILARQLMDKYNR